jgi:hypothetical protein
MKRAFIIMLVLGFCISIGSLAMADEIPAPMCDDAGLTGSAWDLCQAYCAAQECDMDPAAKSCVMLRKNMKKVSGDMFFPCDTTISCLLCVDVVGFGTEGECEERVVEDCASDQMVVEGASCDVISIPGPGLPGCIDMAPWVGMIPNCQNGIPGWVCSGILGGTVMEDELCPYPLNSCYDE